MSSLTLPHADLALAGSVRLEDAELTRDRARGGQAHLSRTKHASRWPVFGVPLLL